ncbi:hypothetical protein [Paracoccus phage vB_PmaS-R3]|uniref:Uncharacterized protein n=1 Tax=Paracoccus phage vB_PmaS-R3 TaxID=2494563 RepID=A0A0B5A7J3_9CAUD|nr:hypothetical protein VC48_gp22 [Paracoccus phage vB_PmaS-R3]AJD83146.1 hypothetical protein [Paracoccus phage vB_PmaS-R3]
MTERMKHRFQIYGSAFFVAVCVLALVAGVLWALWQSLHYPTVYGSYSTGYCVRVEDPRGVHSCENLPPRFYHVWTE